MSAREYSTVREVKARLNLADIARRYMELRRAGGRWMGLCPFHQEKTPSFSINEEEGFYYCFGCQASGDLIDFYCRINGLEFREGLEQLAEEAGVEVASYAPDPKARQDRDVRKQCMKMYDIARQLFRQNLRAPVGSACRAYIDERKLAPEIVDNFELGWAPDEWQLLSDSLQRHGFSQQQGVQSGLLSRNERGRMYDRFRGRFMFPIKNLSGQVIAFGGRVLDGEEQAKYINSSDTPIYKKGEHLYGLFQARRSISAQKRVLLTEGYMDVLTLHQFGYTNACGVLGTALTPDQVKRLGGFCSSVDVIFDGDEAGRKAALRSCEMILSKGMQCRVVLMPDGEDIDSLLHSGGADAFERLLRSAPEGIEYCIQTVGSFAPRDMLGWVKQFLDSLEQKELRSLYISRLAGGLGLNELDIRQDMAPPKKKEPAPQQPQPQKGQWQKRASRGQFGKQKRLPLDLVGPAVRPRVAMSREKRVLEFLVRYPQHLSLLEEHGARELLVSLWASTLWETVALHGGEDALAYLAGKERDFWIKHRVVDSVPADREQDELNDLLHLLADELKKGQGDSLIAAKRQMPVADEEDADMQFLRALNDSLGRSNGEY